MDLIAKSVLFLVPLVLFVCMDVEAVTPNTTVSGTSVAASSAGTSAIASVTTPTPKPTTKAPISCITGKCVGKQQCANATVTAGYTKTSCATGACVAVNVTSTSTYNFKCANKDCDADIAAAPNGTKVFCCEKPNCNTYEAAQSSATRAYSISAVTLTGILLIMFN